MSGDGDMNVLVIGNGFSHDATRYLHDIAVQEDYDMTVVNLSARKCSLSEHYKNYLTDDKGYSLEYNGETTGFKTSIKEAVLSRDWDVVVLQQEVSQSADYDNFQPYLDNLAKHIRKYAPKAGLMLHQNWAYEQGSKELEDSGYTDKLRMSIDIKEACEKAASDIKADLVIPSGDLFLKMISNGVTMHRDGVRASEGIGSYALGLLWYSTLTGRRVDGNNFTNFIEPVSEEEIEIAKRCVAELNYF